MRRFTVGGIAYSGGYRLRAAAARWPVRTAAAVSSRQAETVSASGTTSPNGDAGGG